ncbi:MAG TPA: prepilin-type N-terminal cleavage/methylation domain-containing protein [Phycisphaerae bacterium]|nr:prepilin-type N-terminal cleavage/methylation domain-containing protein [Phycisphaerae bacterium]
MLTLTELPFDKLRTAKLPVVSGRESKGFTLVELLVVIAILSLLASILLPGLARAKELARRVMCLSNVRAMAVASHQYAGSHQDTYPIAKYTPADTSVYVFLGWDFRYRRDGAIEAGLLWSTGENQQVQQCPGYRGPANFSGDCYTGYNYNTSYIGHGQWEAIFAPAKTDSVRSPASCALFGDGQWSGGANKYMRAPFKNPGDEQFTGRYAGTQGYRHVNTTNVSFCDGHAESLSQRYTEIEPAGHQANIGEGTGFLSPDNGAYDLE